MTAPIPISTDIAAAADGRLSKAECRRIASEVAGLVFRLLSEKAGGVEPAHTSVRSGDHVRKWRLTTAAREAVRAGIREYGTAGFAGRAGELSRQVVREAAAGQPISFNTAREISAVIGMEARAMVIPL